MKNTKIILSCNGKLLRDHDDVFTALDYLPTIGSVINYKKLTRTKEGDDSYDEVKYRVISHEFFTSEYYNGLYTDKKVIVDLIYITSTKHC